MRVSNHDLRRLERFTGRERPREIIGVQANDDARRAELLDLRRHLEAAAVDEREAVDVAREFVRVRTREREERRLLVRARAARAARELHAAHEADAFERALGGMAAVQAQAVEVVIRKIEAEARGVLEAQRFAPRIHIAHGAR